MFTCLFKSVAQPVTTQDPYLTLVMSQSVNVVVQATELWVEHAYGVPG